MNKLQRNVNVAGLAESKITDVEGNIKKKVTEITDKLVNNQMTTEPARTVILKKTTTGAANDETIVQKADIRGFARTSSKTVAGITEKKIEVAIAPYVEPDKPSSQYYKQYTITFNPDTGQIISGQNDYDQLMALKRSDFKADLPAIEDSQIDVPGYTAIITSATPAGAGLEAETYTFGHPQTITIDYTKVKHTVTYQFKDPFGNQVGTSVPVTGAVGSSQPVSLTLPAGYQLTSVSLPTSVTIPESDKTISIPVKHQLTITLSGESVFNYADDNWQNLVETNELPASGYYVEFNDANARVQLNDGDVTYNENRNAGTYTVSLTEKGLNDIKDQSHDNFIYPDLKDVKSEAKFIINKGNKTISLMGGDTKVFDNTSTLPDQGTFYSGLGLADDDQGRISVYNSDGTLRTIQLKPNDVEFWLNGHKIAKNQAKNVGNYNLRLTDDFINKVKAADGNNGNNYEWSYGTHTPTGSDTYTADYSIYQATGKANLSGNNSKLYDGNAVTTDDVNKGRKITIDLTLPVYKQAAEPGDVSQLSKIVPLGKYTLQDGDYTWANGTAPTKGGSYTINLNKDRILAHLQDRLVALAGKGTDPDDSTKSLSNVTISADDMDGHATFAIETTTACQFVDDDDNGSKVGTPVSKTGLKGESSNISLAVPTNYVLAAGQTLPTSVTFGDTNNTIRIHLKHKKTSVDGRNHKDDNDIYRTVTRTITVNIEGQPTQVKSQEVSLYRIKTVDEALKAAGKPKSEYTTYSAWTSNMSDGSTSFATVPVPADGNGYVRSITGGTIEKDKVTEQSALNNGEPAKDITVTVNYAKAEQTTTVTYVDKDGNEIKMPDGQPVAGSHYEISGKTGDTVNTDVKDKVPAGWEIIPGTKYPTTVTFGSTPTSPIKVKVEHKITKTDGRNHKDKQDLYREVTRTILMSIPNATSQGKETETLSFYRIMTHDEVTGDNTYSEWKSDVAGDKTAFDEFDVSKTNDGKEIAAGYTPTSRDVTLETKNGDKFVPSQSALKNGVPADSFTVEVAYTPNAQKTTVTYVDENGREITNPDGSVIPGSHYDLTGVTDQSNIPTNIQDNVPTNWHITDPEVPATITFGADGHTPITVHVAHNTKTVDKNDVPDNYKESDFSKTIKRTITANEPSKSVDLSQKTELTRTGTYDVVTKKVISYGNWTTGKFDEVKAPEVAGYTPNLTSVNAEPKVTTDYVDPKLVINYTPNDQTGKISYVDVNTGTEVGTTRLTGKTDSDVTITPSAPAGWKIVDGQNIPKTEKVTPTGIPPVTVKVEHKTTAVPPTDPKTPKDKLPDNPDKHYPDGVSEKDLNKTVVRQITVVKPDGTKESHDQSIKLTRTATVDEVTGEVTKYSDWTTGNFGEYDAPVIPGYTPSQAKVEGVKVTADSDFTPVEITYAPNAQKTTVTYVDENGKEITNPDGSVIPGSHYDVTGVTNKKVDTNIQKNVPTNWHITDPEVPATITFGADGHTPITVHVAHNTKTVDKNDVPDNYKESDF